MRRIDRQELLQHQEDFLRISLLSEEDIQNIWRQPRETKLSAEEIRNMRYNYDIPLFQKMIFRFRQNHQQPACFYNNIDMCNQRLFLSYYDLSLMTDSIANGLNFLAWITNMISEYEMQQLISDIDLLQEWIKNNISFFFSLEEKHQELLIDKYNIQCIDRYNQLIDY